MVTTKTIRKRGRPPAFDRAEAIDVALDLFWKKGFDGVGVAELGEAIGINPPSLYKAFASKHGLFEEAVNRYLAEDRGGFLSRALASAETLEDAVYNLLVEAAKSYTNPKLQAGCLILSGTCNSNDSEAIATTETHRHATKAYLSSVFLEYGAQDADALADYVLIAMTGLSCAARQGIKQNILINTAKLFAVTGLLSGHPC